MSPAKRGVETGGARNRQRPTGGARNERASRVDSGREGYNETAEPAETAEHPFLDLRLARCGDRVVLERIQCNPERAAPALALEKDRERLFAGAFQAAAGR